ncbi:MAG: hypothetical protein JWQ15_1860, partial [Marmoricola sp.]|nr:hypothetical protein [Marmoricola sp.]
EPDLLEVPGDELNEAYLVISDDNMHGGQPRFGGTDPARNRSGRPGGRDPC